MEYSLPVSSGEKEERKKSPHHLFRFQLRNQVARGVGEDQGLGGQTTSIITSTRFFPSDMNHNFPTCNFFLLFGISPPPLPLLLCNLRCGEGHTQYKNHIPDYKDVACLSPFPLSLQTRDVAALSIDNLESGSNDNRRLS